jgi:hypothetical protein
MDFKRYGSPIVITRSSLSGGFDGLYELLKERLANLSLSN